MKYYFKSTTTEQVYELDFISQYEGYIQVSEQDYIEWKKQAGI